VRSFRSFDNRVCRRLESRAIASRRIQRLRTADDHVVREIRWKGHIDRPAMIEHLGDQPLGLVGNVLRRDDCARAFNGFRHFTKEIKLTITQCVMHQRAARLRRPVRHTNQVKYCKVLRICSSDGIDSTQFAHSIGRTDGAYATNASIPISGIRSIKLVATSNLSIPGDLTMASSTGKT
jgi:hypothetical protein